MASALKTASSLGSTGLGIALPLLGVNPVVGGIVAAGAGLTALLGKIGVGRKTANQMTQGQGPQAVINQQLQTIANDPNTSVVEKAQATDMAWSEFLQNTNQFAQNKKLPGGGEDAALVGWQAINKTPGLTNTVSSLLAPLGKTAFDDSYKAISPLMGAAKPAKGSSLSFGDFVPAITAAGTAVATNALRGSGGGGGGSTESSGGAGMPDSTGSFAGLDDEGNPIPADNGGFVGPLDPNNPQSGSTGSSNPANQFPPNSTPGSSNTILNSIFGKNPLTSLLQTAGLITNGFLQSNAAQNAAGLQAGAATNAANLEAKTAGDVLNFEKQIYGNEQAANAPFLEAGKNALSQIQSLIAPGGDLSKPFVAPEGAPSSTFTLPTADQVRKTPGYQLELDEAMKALGIQTKGVVSGASLKAADEFATNFADTKYGDETNRELAAFNTNQGAYQNKFGNALTAFQTNRNNTLQPLLTLAGFGPQAVAANTQAGSDAARTTGSVATTAAENIGNLGQQGAAATAAGNVGSTNAITNAITGGLNNLSSNNILNAILPLLAQNNPDLMRQLRGAS